ncbi:MAG: ATP synthase subunit I [Ferruginibacter sp.]
MNEITYVALSLTGGILLGALFFGGLWYTVKKAVASKIPALWFFSSFLIRVGVTLAGFYFIGAGNWKNLLACMVGFIVARFVVIRYTKLLDESKSHLTKEAVHGA